MGKRGIAPGRHGERDLGIIRRYQNGETLRAIGKSLGITYERVRQILYRELGKDASAACRATRHVQKAIRETRLPMEQCIVCWQPMPRAEGRRRRTTCGHECWQDYQIVGYQIDPERRRNQRLRTARWIARNPDAVQPHHVRYYAKIVSGAPIKSNGRWVNSERVRLTLEKVMAKRALAPTEWHVEFPQVADSFSLTK